MRSRIAHRLAVTAVAVVIAGCAARVPPPAGGPPAHPDFVYPSVPATLQGGAAARHHELGWQYLQADDASHARDEFGSALKSTPAFFPAMAGQGYVALATGRHAQALEAFDATLERVETYAPALVGKGQALLALERPDEAATAFEAAAAADPSLSELRDRVAVLRLRGLQDQIDRARAAATAGRLDESRQAYERALAASPESAFLHRELAAVEQRRRDDDGALAHFRRAVELDPSDVGSRIEIATLLERRQDLDGALDVLREAYDLDPRPGLGERVAALAERSRDARLPPEFRAIADAPQLTRGDLAALIGVRFEPVLRAAPARPEVITDAAGHWAADWIRLVAAAGVIEPFDNHTFQPGLAVTRADLAAAARRVALLVDPNRPELSLRAATRPKIADVPPAHLSYPAVSFAVTSQVMPLESGRFDVARVVTGAEAVGAVDRLRRFTAR